MEEIENIELYLNKLSINEIEKFKKSHEINKNFDKYLYKEFEKIFKKLIFPYLRFEILLNCIKDAKNNSKLYMMADKENYEINLLFQKVQNICLYLNLILEEYLIILSNLEH